MAFKWCTEFRQELEDVKRLPGGSVLWGEICWALKRVRDGWQQGQTKAYLPIRLASVRGESEWTVFYSGEDGDYVGLLLIECSSDAVPQAAHEIAKERLLNLQL